MPTRVPQRTTVPRPIAASTCDATRKQLPGRPHLNPVPALLRPSPKDASLVRLPDLDPSRDRPQTRIADNLLPVVATPRTETPSAPQPLGKRPLTPARRRASRIEQFEPATISQSRHHSASTSLRLGVTLSALHRVERKVLAPYLRHAETLVGSAHPTSQRYACILAGWARPTRVSTRIEASGPPPRCHTHRSRIQAFPPPPPGSCAHGGSCDTKGTLRRPLRPHGTDRSDRDSDLIQRTRSTRAQARPGESSWRRWGRWGRALCSRARRASRPAESYAGQRHDRSRLHRHAEAGAGP